jgi:phosphohistidine phosphatase SixA
MDLATLNKVIFIRHGAFDDGNDFLNQKGISQIQEIKTNLQTNFLQNINYKVISSTGKRAIQSAKIFSNNNVDLISDQLIYKKSTEVDLHSILILLTGFSSVCGHLMVFTHGEFIKVLTIELQKEFLFQDPITNLERGTCFYTTFDSFKKQIYTSYV